MRFHKSHPLRRKRACGNECGFSLLETLVAFVIVALALSEIFEGGLAGLHAMHRANRTRQALITARTHLDEITHAPPSALAQTRIWEGNDPDGMHWRVSVKPLLEAPRLLMPLRLAEIQVSVWSHEHGGSAGGESRPDVTLTTRHMAGVR